MPERQLLLLTYLAQVRQLVCKSVWLYRRHVSITPHILPIRQQTNHGRSRKAIVTIGIAPVAVLIVQKKSTDVWLQVAGSWQKRKIYISSRSHAEERK